MIEFINKTERKRTEEFGIKSWDEFLSHEP
jgi:hypothetical protein